MLDLDITLEKIKTAAKFINRLGTDKLIVCSGRQYAETPIEKFCEMLDSKTITWKIHARNSNKSIITILH